MKIGRKLLLTYAAVQFGDKKVHLTFCKLAGTLMVLRIIHSKLYGYLLKLMEGVKIRSSFLDNSLSDSNLLND